MLLKKRGTVSTEIFCDEPISLCLLCLFSVSFEGRLFVDFAQLDQVTRGRTTGKTFNIKKPDGSTVGVPEVLDKPDFG